MLLLKSIIYRIYSSIITSIIVYIFTGSFNISFYVGVTEFLVKIVSYWLYDLSWIKLTKKVNKGKVILLTGLSGSGKTTLANEIKKKIDCIVLDGDIMRQITNANGFDEVARKEHNLRIAKLASEFESQGKMVIISLIAPYESTRQEMKQLCKNLKIVYVDAALETCIKRDPKGLYKRVQNGEIKNFTGIDSAYEIPTNPDLTLNSNKFSKEALTKQLITFIK